MTTYRLYIGANNTSKLLHIDKIKKVIQSYFPGYTVFKGTGYYKGEEEDTAIVEICTNKRGRIYRLMEELKKKLNQEEIGVQALPEIEFK